MAHVKKCQICGKRASMFLTQIVNGKATELALCEACAKAKGLFDPQTLSFAEKFFPEDFRKRVDKLVEELGIAASGDADAAEVVRQLEATAPGKDLLTCCPVCSFTLEDYRRTGRLGCPDCYEVFTREIHSAETGGTGDEAGTATAGGAEPESPAVLKGLLEAQLRQAVEAENYEEAARLRDRIRQMEDTQNN